MNSISPKKIASIIALTASSLSGVIMIVFAFFLAKFLLIAVAFVLSIIVYLIIYWFVFFRVKHFIAERLNPLYRILYNQDIEKTSFLNSTGDETIIEEVNLKVLDWSKSRTKEIAQLKQMEKYRKEFLGNVSHELKTPIFNIQGYILTLLDGGIEDEKINRLYLEKTEKNINRMISIVEDLEAISRLESGELKLEYQTFNIISLINEIIEMNERRCKAKKIKLSYAQNYDKPVKVYADKKRITDVLNNLIVNSIIYGIEYGKTIISIFDVEENVLIEVTDNGLGISEEDLPRIFERFYRVDKSRSREEGGTGLGLAIVKHVIEAHGQKITVRSKISEGTTFSFTLKKYK